MKYHKIRNVPLEVCTAEQKIAYNYAWGKRDLFEKDYKQAENQDKRNQIVEEAVEFMLSCRRSAYDYNPHKYNEEAIHCALQNGLENYFNAKHRILSSYEEIGKMFPLAI